MHADGKVDVAQIECSSVVSPA
eukprot:COSAG06_NODE_58011_length_278_cov_0.860335_1_plen_21_part_01